MRWIEGGRKRGREREREDNCERGKRGERVKAVLYLKALNEGRINVVFEEERRE